MTNNLRYVTYAKSKDNREVLQRDLGLKQIAAVMVPTLGRLLRIATASTPRSSSHAYSSSRRITTKLFVGGLSFYTTEDVLRQKFSEFGEVVDVKIIMDRVSQRSKGFGFIWYASEMDAEKAKTEMDGKALNGRIINVDDVKSKHAKSQLRGDLPGA